MRTAVYRLFDERGIILYIGVTDHPKRRWGTHASTKEWWPQVHTKKLVWFESRDEALAAERAAIFDEEPVHNVRHMLTSDQKRLLDEAVQAAGRARESRAVVERIKARILDHAHEMRRAGFTDLDICQHLRLSRSTLNRKLGARPTG